ncbi:MAG: transcription termination factor Rho, partial [Bacteroidales bacterium]|nr:transcription termination factor Rho [Bacteroidales bacterium]
MPHSLFELNSMSEEQLRTLAESLDIKGTKKMDSAALGFAILDKEAVIESQKPASAPDNKAKKRGRPRKEEKPAPAAEKPAAPAAPKAEEKPAGNRKKKQAGKPEAQQKPAEEKPAQKPAEASADAPQPAARKRGRKTKNAPETPAEPVLTADKPAAEEKAPEAPVASQVDGKQFIHDLFDDLKSDTAQQPEKPRKQHQQQRPQQPQPQPKPRIEFEGSVVATGVLEVMPDGYGFLRSSDYNYLNSPDDIYVSQQQIKQNALKNGDTVTGEIRPPREGDKYFPLVKINYINGRTPDFVRDRVPFDFLTPLFPTEKFNLLGHGHEKDQSIRVVDMFTPIGKGQRGLIVA